MTLANLLRRVSVNHIRHQELRTRMALLGIALGVLAAGSTS